MEIQLWREILDPYRQAVDELTVKFDFKVMYDSKEYKRNLRSLVRRRNHYT